MAAAALSLAACGTDKDGGGASERERAQDNALKFSRCMREHGVDMPDPTFTGHGIQIGPGPGGKSAIRPDDATFQAAQRACGKYLKNGLKQATPAQRAEMRDKAVRYAQCMRRHGIDMPDPDPNGGFTIHKSDGGATAASGPDFNAPAFKSADTACHDKLGMGKAGEGPMLRQRIG